MPNLADYPARSASAPSQRLLDTRRAWPPYSLPPARRAFSPLNLPHPPNRLRNASRRFAIPADYAVRPATSPSQPTVLRIPIRPRTE